MKRYTITCQQQSVHITEWGTEQLPTIVCFHGLGSTSLSFIEIAEALADEFRLIAMDLPGHGKTPAFSDPLHYRMKPFTDWIDEVLHILDIKRCYALSHSWGSVLSLYYLIEHADRVLGTILIDGGYHSKRLYGRSVEEEAFMNKISRIPFQHGTNFWTSPFMPQTPVAPRLLIKPESIFFGWRKDDSTGMREERRLLRSYARFTTRMFLIFYRTFH